MTFPTEWKVIQSIPWFQSPPVPVTVLWPKESQPSKLPSFKNPKGLIEDNLMAAEVSRAFLQELASGKHTKSYWSHGPVEIVDLQIEKMWCSLIFHSKMAIEIVDLPINSMVIFHTYVSLPEGSPLTSLFLVDWTPIITMKNPIKSH